MVSLKKVGKHNWERIAGMKVRPEQEPFVASNAFYLAQAKFEKGYAPFGIYDAEDPVGFCMYCLDENEDEYWISQLMIDAKFQSRGYGRAAMLQLLEKIRCDKRHNKIFLSFEPENEWAKSLYESLGFVYDGRMAEEDLVYRLDY